MLSSPSTSTRRVLEGVKVLVPVVGKIPIKVDELLSGFHHQPLALVPLIFVISTVIGVVEGFQTMMVSPSVVLAVAL